MQWQTLGQPLLSVHRTPIKHRHSYSSTSTTDSSEEDDYLSSLSGEEEKEGEDKEGDRRVGGESEEEVVRTDKHLLASTEKITRRTYLTEEPRLVSGVGGIFWDVASDSGRVMTAFEAQLNDYFESFTLSERVSNIFNKKH